jgi:hypothetical protein
MNVPYSANAMAASGQGLSSSTGANRLIPCLLDWQIAGVSLVIVDELA